jgi:hypothetical protein
MQEIMPEAFMTNATDGSERNSKTNALAGMTARAQGE